MSVDSWKNTHKSFIELTPTSEAKWKRIVKNTCMYTEWFIFFIGGAEVVGKGFKKLFYLLSKANWRKIRKKLSHPIMVMVKNCRWKTETILQGLRIGKICMPNSQTLGQVPINPNKLTKIFYFWKNIIFSLQVDAKK